MLEHDFVRMFATKLVEPAVSDFLPSLFSISSSQFILAHPHIFHRNQIQNHHSKLFHTIYGKTLRATSVAEVLAEYVWLDADGVTRSKTMTMTARLKISWWSWFKLPVNENHKFLTPVDFLKSQFFH